MRFCSMPVRQGWIRSPLSVTLIGVRLHDQQIAEIDAWIAAQDQVITRPEAIRRLVELGLGAKPKS